MYQIILLVLLAPVLYLFLKNIWTGAAFLLVLLVALFKGVALPELNLDALIYYSFAAYAALHGRKWAEAVWSWKRAGVPAGSGNRAQQELLYPLFCAGNRSLPASGSHRYLDDGKRALAGRSQTVYDLHLFYLCDALCGGPFPQ